MTCKIYTDKFKETQERLYQQYKDDPEALIHLLINSVLMHDQQLSKLEGWDAGLVRDGHV